MSINLVTYANQTVTPTNDAIIYERAIDQNGIFYGCNVTVTSNTVNITGGYGIVCGREFVINSDSLTVTLAPSGTLQGRLYVRLDLADADAPIQLLTVTGNTLPALTQDDDVNYTNGVYEMELATFTVGVSALSDVVETFDTVIGTAQALKADYIVEEGASGNWSYRKWNSGIGECWGRFPFSGVSAAGTVGGFNFAVIQSVPNFPFAFVAIPTVSVGEFDWGTGVTLMGVNEVSYTKVTYLNIYSTNIGDKSGVYSLYAIGKWK